MTIRTTGKGAGLTDSWSWGRFWENGVALVGMCVREGMQGVQTRLGELGVLVFFGKRVLGGGGGGIGKGSKGKGGEGRGGGGGGGVNKPGLMSLLYRRKWAFVYGS